jgi:alkaline phosphatase D
MCGIVVKSNIKMGDARGPVRRLRNQEEGSMQRRDFVRGAGFVFATTLVFGASACAQPARLSPAVTSARRAFPWGVASADPQPEAVMVWTKLVPSAGGGDEDIIMQIGRDELFGMVDHEQVLTARQVSDHTVRILVKGLLPDTTYFYRFVSMDGATSRTGRTWTAPSPDAARPVLIALASCQSYPASQFGSYRHLIMHEARTGQRPDFVLHLGDYVYGTSKDLPLDPQTGLTGPDPLDVQLSGPMRPGNGGADAPALTASRQNPSSDPAAGLFDYDAALAATRALYSKYHLDRDLQDARALFPFVTIWDDHEFGNDVWQSFSGIASNPVGRMAATQSWSEWVPQVLSENQSIPNVANEARDFRRSAVETEQISNFDDDFLAHNAQNLAAIGAMTSYRALRWGALVDIILTDNRSYRGPGASPAISLDTIAGGDAPDGIFTGLSLVDGEALHILAEGRFANGGNPPAFVTINGREIPNPRRDAPRVSLLGARQKEWFKNALSSSEARWKVWANPQPITGFQWDIGKIKPEIGSGFNWLDSWDGFPNERRELLSYIRENRISNVVSLSGDRHAQFAGCVADDYMASQPDYVIPEFVCTGISAFPRVRNLANIFRRLGIGEFAQTQLAGSADPVCTLDAMITMGARATQAIIAGEGEAAARALAGEGPNPEIHYSDMDSHGYLLAHFTHEKVSVEFVTMPRPVWDVVQEPEGPPALRRTVYETHAWDPAQKPELSFVEQTGEPTLRAS